MHDKIPIQRRRLTVVCVSTTALLLCLPPPAAARVFWRRLFPEHAGLAATDGGLVYKTKIRVNNGQGIVRIIHAEKEIGAAIKRLEQLAQAKQLTCTFIKNETTAYGFTAGHEKIRRYLLLAIPQNTATLIFELEQTPLEYQRSLAPPREIPAHLPFYPDAQLAFFAESTTTRAQLYISHVNSGAANAALDYYRHALSATGCQPLLPAAGKNYLCYGKANILCCVLVEANATTDTCSIIFLQKQWQ